MSPRFGASYIRTRYIPLAGAALIILAAVAFLFAKVLLRGGHGSQQSLLPVVLWAPVGASATISLTLVSPMLEIELSSCRDIRLYGILVLLALTILAACLLAPSGVLGGSIYGWMTLSRNVAGLVGVAMLVAPLVGGRLSWSGPVIFGLVLNGVAPNEGPIPPIWAWPLRSEQDASALWSAVTLYVFGLLVVYRWYARAHRPAHI